MSAPAEGARLEAVLARLYVEPEFRARFLAATEATLAASGLTPEECRALAGLVDEIELSAAEFERLIAAAGLGLGLDYRRKLVVGKTVYGRDREVDVLFRDARNGNRLVVEAKYQRVAGTADEKLPYAVLNQQTLPLPGVIVYGGGGFHLGALHWLCANTKATDIARLPEWLTVFFAL